LKHFASPDFWYHYRGLPADVQQLADRCFALMNSKPLQVTREARAPERRRGWAS